MVKEEMLINTLKELDKENKFIYLMTDWYFKKFLKENKIFLCKLINSLLNLNINEEDIIFENTNLTKQSKNEYNKDVDILLKVGKYITIDIECNSVYFDRCSARNLAYVNKIYGMCFKVGTSDKEIKKYKVFQINLNPLERNLNNSKIRLAEDYIYETGEKTGKIYLENKKIVVKYLDYFRYLYYTLGERSEEVVLLTSLTSKTYEEFYNILSNVFTTNELNGIMERMISMDLSEFWAGGAFSKHNYEKMVKENEAEYRARELEEYYNKGISTGKEDGISIGKKEGISIGEQRGKRETLHNLIHNMIKNNIPLEDVSKISGKPLSKIKKIAENITKTTC